MKATPLQIICVAQPSWSGTYAKSTVLLMKELAKSNHVLYVDYAYTWKDVWMSWLGRQTTPVKKMFGIISRLEKVDATDYSSLSVLTLPPMMPVNFLPAGWLYQLVNSVNGKFAQRAINSAMKKLHFKKPVVVNAFSPGLGHALLGKLNESLTVYYNYDDINSAAWAGKHGGRMERQFAPKADMIIVSSDQLCEERKHLNANIHVVKNGVDIGLFERSNPFTRTVPSGKPVAGFVGSLDSRIDYKLLNETIKKLPHYEFVFVGRVVSADFEILKEHKNVTWISPVAYECLPDIIQTFDVGLIPFIKSSFTEKIYPLKINEYLAMGKPVVMTSFATFPEFTNLVNTADDAESFSKAIIVASASSDQATILTRKKMARQNSWHVKANEFTQLISTRLHEKILS